MIVIGCDVHPVFQQIAVLDMESGGCEQRKLLHATGEAEQFYRRLASPSRVASSRWVGAIGLCSF